MHGYGDGHGGVSVPMAQAVETDEQMAWRIQQQYNQQRQPPQAYAQPVPQPQAHAQPAQQPAQQPQPQPQPQRRTTMESQVGMWRFVQRTKRQRVLVVRILVCGYCTVLCSIHTVLAIRYCAFVAYPHSATHYHRITQLRPI
jgi:hypothetical protein